MTNLLIKGIEMPKDGLLCIGIEEGRVFYKHPSEKSWHISDYFPVEVVLCKDCKDADRHTPGSSRIYCPWVRMAVEDEWFCADGVRKKDEDSRKAGGA